VRREAADVVVIGSGAGGSVVAHAAASRGLRTLIVERGPYVRGRDMSHREVEMFARLYKDSGMQLNASMDLVILQGSCVGGSTVLANNVMFRAPGDVLNDWKRHGATLDRAALAASYEKIESALGVGPSKAGNITNGSRLLYEGARAAGYDAHWMQTALGACTGCGGCNMGCVWDHKLSALTTFIPWAEAKGARVLADTTIDRIEWRRGTVTGLLGHAGEKREPITISAKVVVVAGGAIGSSALLLKSGIRRNVGTRLSFNAGGTLLAEFPDPVDSFDGEQMSCYVTGEGYTLEPVFSPPVSIAMMTPGWFDDHARLMANYRHLACAAALVGTLPNGRVVHSRFFGHEEIRFHLQPRDLAKLKAGFKAIARAWFSAGAKRVVLPTHTFAALTHPDEVDRIDELCASTRLFDIGSSHPQGGNPLSDDPSIGVVDRNFAVHGFDNLFVCDASVFTSSIRVNPLNTVMAIADYAAPRILAHA
jgi:choline dehydrogenase-like flavoprotein